MTPAPAPRLEVRGLKTHFFTEDGVVKAVDDVSYAVAPGATLGLVGESGCGKSVSALSIMRLIDPPGRIVAGAITLNGTSLLDLTEPQMRQVRGNRISMIFQEPMTSLNPVFTVGSQIAETILTHARVSKAEALRRAVVLLRKVRIPAPETRVHEYPHQLSGGMRQRVMIAMALACEPEVIIADEPTTALDVTIQAQIMELLAELQRESGMSIILITHNLGLVAQTAGSIAVMYASRIVEKADTAALFASPLHPYTHGLLASIPRLGTHKDRPLAVIPGRVPNPARFPGGCKFHPRCRAAVPRCAAEEPPLLEHSPGRWAACHRIEGGCAPPGTATQGDTP